jgi:hypothetical protein
VAAINCALRFTRKDTGGEFDFPPLEYDNFKLKTSIVFEFATSIRKDAEPRESKLPGCRSPL